ncbi:4'-phosphopantetheinyl transferase family protein [Streptomyces sp. NPDC002513]
MFDSLLPASAVVRETRSFPPEWDLHPEELAVVASSVEKRRREFAEVRRCARDALSVLGQRPASLLLRAKGEPRWPTGVIGSMTHCVGFAGAAVARATDLASLGIDAEPHDVQPDGVLEAIALPPGRALIGRLAREQPSVCWDRLLFCAKKAVYKTWFPLTRRWLDFDEALIDLRIAAGSAGGSFTARLLVPGIVVDDVRIGEFEGRRRLNDGLLATAIAVPLRAGR